MLFDEPLHVEQHPAHDTVYMEIRYLELDEHERVFSQLFGSF